MGNEENAHLKRQKFKRWQGHLPRETKVLSDNIEATLVPKVLSAGYEVQDLFFGDRKDRVSPSEIHFERVEGERINYVTFSFDKYRRPKFQVHFGSRQIVAPFALLSRGNLVSKSGEYYHFWGKPWWLPNSMWSDRCSTNVVQTVAAKLDQVFDYLQTGARGPNISRPI